MSNIIITFPIGTKYTMYFNPCAHTYALIHIFNFSISMEGLKISLHTYQLKKTPQNYQPSYSSWCLMSFGEYTFHNQCTHTIHLNTHTHTQACINMGLYNTQCTFTQGIIVWTNGHYTIMCISPLGVVELNQCLNTIINYFPITWVTTWVLYFST